MSKRRKPETDSELLSRYKQIEANEIGKGKTFDLEHELCAAIARRDYKVAEKKLGRRITVGVLVHYAIQLALVFFIYVNWDDLKIVLVLSLVMLWRSINYNADQIKHLQTRTIEWLAMTHPTAKDDFFRSEHCYGSQIRDRVFDLLHPRTTRP
jgi:hypothetical protein